MAGLDELHLKAAKLDPIPRLDASQRPVLDSHFLELVLDERHRKACSVNGDVQIAKHIRQRADMILMSVRN